MHIVALLTVAVIAFFAGAVTMMAAIAWIVYSEEHMAQFWRFAKRLGITRRDEDQ